MALSDSIQDARAHVDTHPTDGQIKAGNYKMGHISVHGMVISIENPRGSYRSGTDKDGHKWKTLMHYDYGYFVKTVGKDGDAIDVFLGPNLESQKVYCVDQYIDGKFDETKVMLGFDSKSQAREGYLSNYEKGWNGLGDITEVDIKRFKKWLYDGYRQRKAFAKYARLYEAEEPFSLKETFNEMKKNINEEEYNVPTIVYIGDDCKGVMDYLCNNGFDRFDLDTDGKTVSLCVERDRIDTDYEEQMVHYAKDLVDEYLSDNDSYSNVDEGRYSQKALSESQLRQVVHNIIKESVKEVLNELGNTHDGMDALGQVAGRAAKRMQDNGLNDRDFGAYKNALEYLPGMSRDNSTDWGNEKANDLHRATRASAFIRGYNKQFKKDNHSDGGKDL